MHDEHVAEEIGTSSLEVDVDTRLAELWSMAWQRDYGLVELLEEDETLRTQFGAFMRAAYGQGYLHALREDAAGRRGELLRSHGYEER